MISISVSIQPNGVMAIPFAQKQWQLITAQWQTITTPWN
jgi:hypothetical protein